MARMIRGSNLVYRTAKPLPRYRGVAPLRRSEGGSFTPIPEWRHYADPDMAPLGRSLTWGDHSR
jgi:hypothetical protein